MNTAIFSVVRGVLSRPLMNREEDRLIYIKQSALGRQVSSATFYIPEIMDIGGHLKTISKLGTFSTVDFSAEGFGETREIHAGVVDGAYFDVMGLKPVLGRLLDERDDVPNAQGAEVLTCKFWATVLHSDPNVLGKAVRLGSMMEIRSAIIVGVLEPSIPYPAETQIIANIGVKDRLIGQARRELLPPRRLNTSQFFGSHRPVQSCQLHRSQFIFTALAAKRGLSATARSEPAPELNAAVETSPAHKTQIPPSPKIPTPTK